MNSGAEVVSGRGQETAGAGTGFGTRADRVLADLALALRRLDLRSFTREVVRHVREGLGVECCEVFGCSTARRGTPLCPREGIGVVLRFRGRPFGALIAYSSSRRRYTDQEARFLRDVGDLLGAAVELAYSAEVCRLAVEESRRADAAEERFAFLHEANAVLASVPDGPAVLAATARLAVPALADACFLDLLEGGPSGRRVRRLVVARHEGGGRLPAQESVRYYPLDPSAPHGTPKVLRTGRPEVIPNLQEGLLRSLAGDREHLDGLRGLEPGSYLCVPLQVGTRLVGSIGLVSSAAGRGRRLGKGEVALAESLARCTALVLANSPGRTPGSAILDTPPMLTPRQIEVLGLLDRGMRVHQIKVELGLSEPTVRTHVRGILRALGACSQLEALHRARALGLVDGAARNAATDRLP